MAYFAFVPMELFEEVNAAYYLPLKNNIRKRANVIFKIFEYYNVVGILDQRQINNSEHILWTLLEKSAPNTGNTIIAHIANNTLSLIAIHDNHLLMANIFKVRSKEDTAYFILSAIENTTLDILQTKVKIYSPEDIYIIPFLKKYVIVKELSLLH